MSSATMILTTKAGGVYQAAVNPCKTPVPPPVTQIVVPYPSIAMAATAQKATTKVLAGNKEILVEGSKMPSSSGDEAGSLGGVISGQNMGEVKPTVFSSKVFAQGKKVTFATAVSAHNGSNPNAPAGQQVGPTPSGDVLVAV